MRSSFADLRYALRRLGRSPTFAVFTIALLALAIGINTAIFSLLDTLAWRALPVRHPEHLVQLAITRPEWPEGDIPLSVFREIERRQTVFNALIGWGTPEHTSITIDGDLSPLNTWFVTSHFFVELNTRPFAGRLLGPDDDRDTAHAASAAVMGYAYWQRHFQRDAAVLGRTFRVNDIPIVVVGIAPPQFSGIGLSEEPDLMLPSGARAAVEGAAREPSPEWQGLAVVGRLKPGVTVAGASAALQADWDRIKAAAVPSSYTGDEREWFLGMALDVTPAAHGVDRARRSELTDALRLAIAGAALLLGLACLNLTGLMLARVAVDARDWAVRAALGASGWQLVRPVLLEGCLLAAAGTCAGVPIAAAAITAFRDWTLQRPVPVMLPVSAGPSLRVFVFVSVVTFLVSLSVSGGAVIWLARRRRVAIGAGRWSTRQRFGPLLVTAQVTLSLVLIMMAALLARNIQELRSTRDWHYRPDNVSVFTLAAQPNGPAVDQNVHQPALVEKVLAIPGVHDAALGFAPTPNFQNRVPIRAAGSGEPATAQLGYASPGFFRTLELSLLQGRDFTWRDHRGAPDVVIVSRSLASRLFGTENAVGRRVQVDTGDGRGVEVVGVVADAKLFSFRDPTPLAAYLPDLQGGFLPGPAHLLVRWSGPATAAPVQVVRQTIAAFGHEYARRTRTLEERADEDLAADRLLADLASGFGVLALLLTSVGLYSLLSYVTTTRRKELGIRLALGAERRRLVIFLVAGGLRLVGTGAVLGTVAAAASGPLIASRLTGVGPYDPLALTVSPLVLLLVALVACLIPALKAARIDPIATLRMD